MKASNEFAGQGARVADVAKALANKSAAAAAKRTAAVAAAADDAKKAAAKRVAGVDAFSQTNPAGPLTRGGKLPPPNSSVSLTPPTGGVARPGSAEAIDGATKGGLKNADDTVAASGGEVAEASGMLSGGKVGAEAAGAIAGTSAATVKGRLDKLVALASTPAGLRVLTAAMFILAAVGFTLALTGEGEDPACAGKVFDVACAASGAAKTAGAAAGGAAKTVGGGLLAGLGIDRSVMIFAGGLLAVYLLTKR